MDRRYLIKPNSEPRFSLLQKELMAIFVIAACAYLLAFEVGLISWLSFLF